MPLLKSCERAAFFVEFRYPLKSHSKLQLSENDVTSLSDYTRVKSESEDGKKSVDFSALHNFVEAAEVNDGAIIKVAEKNSEVYMTACFENCSELASFIEAIRKDFQVVIKSVFVEYMNPLKYSNFDSKSPLSYVKTFEKELDLLKKASRRKIYWLQRTIRFFKIADELKGEVVSKNDGKVLVNFKDLNTVVKFNTRYYENA